jgi:long-chain fatty acid transport protein
VRACAPALALLVSGSACLGALAAWPSEARASGFSAARFGGEHGNPTESNPTALYYNPAGIAFSEGIHLFGDGSIALRHASWEHAQSAHDVAEPPGAEGANYGKATLTNVFAGPALAATMKVKDLAFGVGLFAPFAGRANYDKNDKFTGSAFPLAADGVARWHAIDGSITSAYLTAGAAYRLGPVSIGASGNLVLSSITTSQAKNLTLGDNDITQEARSALDVSGIHGSFGVGAMWEAVERKLWLGVSYQAAPGISGMKLTGTLTNTSSQGSRKDDVDFIQHLPDVVRLGGRFRPIPELELRLFGDYTRWSKMVDQCITLKDRPCGINQDGTPAPGTGTVVDFYRGWHDTFGIRAGASYWLKASVEVFAGVGFERSAIPDTTLDPGLPDADTISPAAGGRFEIFEKLWLGASYTHIQYLNRDNTGKSILDDPTVAPTTRRVDGGGKYAAWIGVLNVNVEKQF